MRVLLVSSFVALVGCQSCPDKCENSGLSLTLTRPTAGFAAIGDRVRISVESNLGTHVTTCVVGESGPATCDESVVGVSTTLATGGRVYGIGVHLTSNPTHVKVTVQRASDGTRIAGPQESTISYPTISETCSCQGGADVTMQM